MDETPIPADGNHPASEDHSTLWAAIRARTPARLLVGRAGSAYRTQTQLELRRDHAAALDAVHAELDLRRDLGADDVERWRLFEVATRAGSKAEYLMRPDLGRLLSEGSGAELARLGTAGADFQVAIGDGLSAAAVAAQVPALLPLLADGAARLGWSVGRPFFVRHCRVGILNEIGETLDPAVVVLLIGERPGLATAESLSAYMAYRPRAGHNDADRNLISNIHARGVPTEAASRRILALAEQMCRLQRSGVAIKEVLDEAKQEEARLHGPGR
jgi:ethanolamine ammonia-lyase small subunit